MIGLGDLPGDGSWSGANAVPADGSVIAGASDTADPPGPIHEAFLAEFGAVCR